MPTSEEANVYLALSSKLNFRTSASEIRPKQLWVKGRKFLVPLQGYLAACGGSGDTRERCQRPALDNSSF